MYEDLDNHHICVLDALHLWKTSPPQHEFHRLVWPEQPVVVTFEDSASRRWPRGCVPGEIWQQDHTGGQLQASRPIPTFLIEATAMAFSQPPPFFNFDSVIDDLFRRNLIGHAESTAWPFPLRLTWKMPDGQIVDLDMIEQGDDDQCNVMVRAIISGGLPVIDKPYRIADPDIGLDQRYVWALRLTNQTRAWRLPGGHGDEDCIAPGHKTVDSPLISPGTPEDQPAPDLLAAGKGKTGGRKLKTESKRIGRPINSKMREVVTKMLDNGDVEKYQRAWKELVVRWANELPKGTTADGLRKAVNAEETRRTADKTEAVK